MGDNLPAKSAVTMGYGEQSAQFANNRLSL